MMYSRILTRLALAGALAASVLPAAAPAHAASSSYCAQMADSIGLYPGNEVTQMGVRIGAVTSVQPEGGGVKVTFSVDDRKLPASVKAVTRSMSILADRSLEMVGNYSSGPTLAPGSCVTRENTATPKSISETTESATQLITSLTEGGRAADLGKLVTTLDRQATPAVGPLLNRTLTNTTTLLSDPAGFLGDVNTVISNLKPLATAADAQWPDVMLMLRHATPVLEQYGRVTFPAVQEIYTILPTFFLVSDDIMRRYGHILRPGFDAAAQAVRLAGSGVRSSEQLTRTLPVFGSIVAQYLPRGDGAPSPGLPTPASVTRVQAPDPGALCARVNQASPGACSVVDGAAQVPDVSLLQMVLTQGGR